MTIGQNIRACRKQRGLTLDDLSALCGVSRDDLGLYERGHVGMAAETTIKQYVKQYIRMIGSNDRYAFEFADNGSRE